MNLYQKQLTKHILSFTALVILLISTAVLIPSASSQPQIVNYELGYGFNVAEWDIGKLQSLGFNWIKVFNAPSSKLPVKVLIRVNANASSLTNLTKFKSDLRKLAENSGEFIDAYEIGNEVNLDASYGWTSSPVAANYVQLLCAAYTEIKQVDPTAVIVSAGLAPTGRVTGSWEGHKGHNGLYQDEREYLQEMLAAGGADCLDAVGYHNYGYRADFDAEPDVHGGTADTNCTNGFCFRGVEKIYAIMQANGHGAKQVWTTEFGWITDPAEEGLASCKESPTWSGRAWQIVSQQKQAENLQGAYSYAADHWPWMGAMFIFNLNFNQASYYPQCEQMRFYSVAGRPAEALLRDMPKAYNQKPPALEVAGPKTIELVTAESSPITHTSTFTLTNSGGDPLTLTISEQPVSGQSLSVTRTGPSADTFSLAPNESATFSLTIATNGLSQGIHYGPSFQISVEPQLAGFPQTISTAVFIVETVYPLYIPLASN